MPKKKFSLSKKHKELIDIEVNIPTLKEKHTWGYHKDGVITDHRGNAENSLLDALEIISKGTQYEDVCKNIIEKSKSIFEEDDNKRFNN